MATAAPDTASNYDDTIHQIQIDVATIKSTLPHLATKAELEQVKSGVDAINIRLDSELPRFATKADVEQVKNSVDAINTKLETELPRFATKSMLEATSTRLDNELPHLATKADVERMGRTLIMWNVSTIIVAVGIVFAILRFMK